MLILGLTGGIGTGKSTVAQILRDKGAKIVDADVLSREVVRPGQPAYNEIVDAFGEELLQPDGQIDRSKLAAIIFNDPVAKKQVEQIIHPRVREALLERLEQMHEVGTTSVVVYEAPLLYETGDSLPFIDKVAVVYAPRDIQKARLMQSRGMTAEEAERRIEAQLPTEGKALKADYVIDNSGDLEDTIGQVERMWEEWLK